MTPDFQSSRLESFVWLVGITLFMVWALGLVGCQTRGQIVTAEGDRLSGAATIERRTLDIPAGSTVTLTLSEATQARSVLGQTLDPIADARAATIAQRPFLFIGGALILLAVLAAKMGHWIVAGVVLAGGLVSLYLWRNPEAIDFLGIGAIIALAIAGLSLLIGYVVRQTQDEDQTKNP
jgi:hypothetical protein